jgi:dTDP-4-amino-4,6-dideoxygalactose transaminase
MIARNRPEASLPEIALALASATGIGDESCVQLASSIQRIFGLNEPPVLAPSGRAALYYLLETLPHKRVYMPAFTCWVVLEAARLAGKEVEFLDSDYPSMNVSPAEWERVAAEPGVVIATHQFGYPEDVSFIMKTLDRRGHFVIEDCAGGLFSRDGSGAYVGHAGHAAIYSFETSKLLTLGAGGMITAKDGDLLRRISARIAAGCLPCRGNATLLRLGLRRVLAHPVAYGAVLALYLMFRPPTESGHVGAARLGREYLNSFSAKQARLGLALLERIHQIIAKRRALHELYRNVLNGAEGIGLVPVAAGADPVPVRFPVLIRQELKMDVYRAMRKTGVDLGFSYSYQLGGPVRCGNAERLAREMLNLPFHTGVDPEMAHEIAGNIRRVVKEQVG